jgi:E3 ubiquitin-protein ligase RGLG
VAVSEFNRLLELAQTLSKKAEEGFRFATITDRYHSLDEVQVGLREAGLENSNLILGIDFTASNKTTGTASFGGRCLHDTTGPQNPYQRVMEIVGRTLESFDVDHLIPAFGFGDHRTRDHSCFPFFPDRPCRGLQEVLNRYGEIAPAIILSGPTNFAPVISAAIDIVAAKGFSYHILVLVGDGQVNSERATIDAIVRASRYPLSIIMVGVGDGPWAMMRRFDDELPERQFDNFQFVEFNRLMADITDLERRHAEPFTAAKGDAYFAMQMLMEIPDQFRAVRELKLLNRAP